jgi:hypothetical protein
MRLFNLLGIDVPDHFERAVITKAITAQDVNTLAVVRTSQLYLSDMAVVAAEAEANITLINANANAQGLLITKQVQANLTQQLMASKTAQLSLLADDLGFTAPDQLLQYLYTDIIRGRTNAKTSVSFGVDKTQVRVDALGRMA